MSDVPHEKSTQLSDEPPPFPGTSSSAGQGRHPVVPAGRRRGFWLATVGLLLGFLLPIWQLATFAAGSELYSYILLIPFISLYLVRQKRHDLPPLSPPARGMAVGFLSAGAIVLFAYWLALRPRLLLLEDDYLALMMIAFLLCFLGVCCWFLSGQFVRANAFALGFLVFLAPIPSATLQWTDTFLQAGSAWVARGLFMAVGTPFLQDGLVIQLPGITLQIAPECSGVHSSLVLFITSLLAGQLFLRKTWKRAVFILAVIPLALLRNGFRVFTIGELCVYIGPHMIDSPIHHKGGPIFFALSLIPLFLLLIYLQKTEKSAPVSGAASQKKPAPVIPA